MRHPACAWRRLSTTRYSIALLILVIPSVCSAKTYLTITSQPSGATVEIDGIAVGKTPVRIEVPGGYLHGTRSVFGKLLRQQMHVRLTLEGYLPAETDLAKGPMPWIALNGVYHGDYWLLKTDTFNFNLEKAATTFTGNVQVALSSVTPTAVGPALPTEDIVSITSPAVLRLRSSEGIGSGFLVSETGIAVTNAHVAKGQNTLVATTGNGQSFESKVVYVDASLDIAFLKLEGHGFPRLQLAETGSVRPGSTVVAIGTPSKGFQNSVTKGIVGGIGSMYGEPGTWIQTDAAINPGNSGGPLLNETGGVVGITTQKRFLSNDGRPLQGIGFALSSDDLLAVLRRFYPNISPSATPRLQATSPQSGVLTMTASQTQASANAEIEITSTPSGAEVQLDGNFVGSTPSTIGVSEGDHVITINKSGYRSWERKLKTGTRKVNLVADLEPDVRREQKTEAAVPVQASATPVAVRETLSASPSEVPGKIFVTSSPVGAEIYADSLFVGKTPYTMKLKPGQHSIVLLMKDYKNWSQTITAEAGSEVQLTVTLEKSN